MTILSDLMPGGGGPSQTIVDWLSTPSAKFGIGAVFFMGGVILIVTHRHSRSVSTLAGHLARSVPIGSILAG